MPLAIAEFLPDIELPSPGGPMVKLRPAIGATTVLAALHSAECAGCRQYVNGLAAIADEFEAWDARLLVVVPAAPVEAMPLSHGRLLIDRRRQIASGTSASVIVADRYSQVFQVSHAGASHNLPEPRELAEWLKFLGTLCPE